MKFQIKVTFAGQTRFFNVDYDDESCSDESYREGVDFNDYMVTVDFMESCQIEILRNKKEGS